MKLDIQRFADGDTPTTTVNIGQYAVSECKFEVKVNGEYKAPADIEEVNISIDNNIETWYGINEDGWQNALLTAKALTGNIVGKRTIGDAGNDYIDSLRYNIGKAAEADYKITFPDDSTLEYTAVTALTDILGAASNVASLNAELTGKGKPNYTPATSS